MLANEPISCFKGLMKKNVKESAFFCQGCGHQERRWHGRCPACGVWNSMVEEKIALSTTKLYSNSDQPEAITNIKESAIAKLSIGIEELDRVIGGGLTPGGITLIGGEPGCGKSTLLQMASLALAKVGHRVLYISGEESKQQIALAAHRLGCPSDNLFILSETDIDRSLQEANRLHPTLLVVDSVQTVLTKDLDSAAGSVAQIREVCAKIVHFAKHQNISTFLVGHVTKDGNIAGPRLLEHMVDTVLYFEQSRSDQYRMLRAHKNRFGPTNEIGLFEMSS